MLSAGASSRHHARRPGAWGWGWTGGDLAGGEPPRPGSWRRVWTAGAPATPAGPGLTSRLVTSAWPLDGLGWLPSGSPPPRQPPPKAPPPPRGTGARSAPLTRDSPAASRLAGWRESTSGGAGSRQNHHDRPAENDQKPDHWLVLRSTSFRADSVSRPLTLFLIAPAPRRRPWIGLPTSKSSRRSAPAATPKPAAATGEEIFFRPVRI